MKTIFSIFFLAISFVSVGQPNELTFEKLRNNLVDFLESKNQIKKEDVEKYKTEQYNFILRGIYNNSQSSKLKNGMYAFSTSSSHGLAFFVLVENNSFTILDISTQKGLQIAINNTLEFCERNKFCVDIITDYVSRLISVYNNVNKNQFAGYDVNCQRGIKDTKELP